VFEQADLMEEEKQQSRIDSPCSSSLLSCTLSDSVTSDAVWAEIELAERWVCLSLFSGFFGISGF
jgi:hypothetical protein